MAGEVWRYKPELKVIFTSGKPLTGEEATLAPFLLKPGRKELVDLIECVSAT